jgi:lipopolysaccharide export system permease protein
VFGGILHRMILWELIKVFAMALAGITGILLMAGIVAEASQEGLGPSQILAAIPLLIPSTLPYTIPATTLFACCVVYGRLAADNEILAIKSSGVNLLQVVGPGLLLGLAASLATMGLYCDVIPTSHRMLRTMAFNDAEELLYSMLRRQHSITAVSMPYAIWVKGVEGRKLLDPVIKGRDAHGETNFVAQAKEAELRVDMAHRKLTIRMRFGALISADGQNSAAFEIEEVPVDLPPSFGPEGALRARDMTWPEMLEKRRRWEEIEAKYDEAIREQQRGGDPAPDPALPQTFLDAGPGPQSMDHLKAEKDYVRQQIVFLDVELLMRPALSIGCFCFVLVGCPVGIWFSRSDYLSSFIVCFLPIVIIYYPLMLCGTGMAKEGRFDSVLLVWPTLLVWGANLLMGVIGVGLFWRLLRK